MEQSQIQQQKQEQRQQQTISAQQLLLSQLVELPLQQLTERIEQAFKKYFNVESVIVSHKIKTGIKINSFKNTL